MSFFWLTDPIKWASPISSSQITSRVSTGSAEVPVLISGFYVRLSVITAMAFNEIVSFLVLSLVLHIVEGKMHFDHKTVSFMHMVSKVMVILEARYCFSWLKFNSFK